MTVKTRRHQIEEMIEQGLDDDGFLRYGLGMEYVSEKDDARAEECFRGLIREKPDYVPGYQQLGQLLARQGREDEAKAAYRDGIARAQKQGNEHAATEMANFMAMLE